jgi:hypothetical protein
MASKDSKELKEVYNIIFQEVARLLLVEKKQVQIVAATLLAQALRLYKSSLNEADFIRMMNSIPESIDNIRPYDELEPKDKQTIN